MSEFKVGDKVIISEKNNHESKFNGRKGIISKMDTSSIPYRVDVYKKDYEGQYCWSECVEHIDEEKQELIENETMEKKVIKVLAVNKKTGKVEKNETVVADGEQTAILKAFGVDADSMYIKTTEEGTFKEDKPVSAVIVKAPKKQ